MLLISSYDYIASYAPIKKIYHPFRLLDPILSMSRIKVPSQPRPFLTIPITIVYYVATT